MARRLTAAQIERLLRRAVEVVPDVMTEHGFGRHTCILHTRVAVLALRALDVDARPLAVKLRAISPELARRLSCGERPDERTAAQWAADGCWEVVIGFGTNENPSAPPPGQTRGYEGHLLVAAGQLVADLTLDQTARPERNLLLDPVMASVSREFLRGKEPLVLQSENGSVAVFEAQPDERSFLRAPDWQKVGPSDVLVRDSVQRIRGR
jgi:hypothetical protein